MSNNEFIGKKTKAVPNEKVDIGIDMNNTLAKNIIDGIDGSYVDLAKLEAFTNVSQTRENIYKLIDTMSQDSTISSVIETYSEDTVDTNDKGQIMWCESSDPNVAKYVSYLLDVLNVDKHAYSWANSLIKYGDLYLRLYKESDYAKDEELFGEEDSTMKTLNETLSKSSEVDDDYKSMSQTRYELNEQLDKEKLNEDVHLNISDKNDHYVHYLEMIQNPGEMYELTKFGKTVGYIKAPINVQSIIGSQNMTQQTLMRYKLNRGDVDVFAASDFVHACLEDNSSRSPEEVSIFMNKDEFDSNTRPHTYSVKRGQSLLSSTFKTWREMSLLENSVLLNRITKSSIVRVIGIEVGDMPKEQIATTLQNVKSMVEQKSAINTGVSMTSYTDPGPIENNVYMATHGGVGSITTTQIGGDVDVKSLVDLEYFRDKFFAGLRVPKQYFGFTDDSTGFNGGSSLSIISSRYGKAIKRIQNALIQCITDAINIMLIDKGLTTYVNKFTLRMQQPITQEEVDRREAMSNKVRVVSDIVNTLSDISNPANKLKIQKSLISTVISDNDILQAIQDEIDSLEEENDNGVEGSSNDVGIGNPSPSPLPLTSPSEGSSMSDLASEEEEAFGDEDTSSSEEALPTPGELSSNVESSNTDDSTMEEALDEDKLPSFSDLGIDGTINK